MKGDLKAPKFILIIKLFCDYYQDGYSLNADTVLYEATHGCGRLQRTDSMIALEQIVLYNFFIRPEICK